MLPELSSQRKQFITGRALFCFIVNLDVFGEVVLMFERFLAHGTWIFCKLVLRFYVSLEYVSVFASEQATRDITSERGVSYFE